MLLAWMKNRSGRSWRDILLELRLRAGFRSHEAQRFGMLSGAVWPPRFSYWALFLGGSIPSYTYLHIGRPSQVVPLAAATTWTG